MLMVRLSLRHITLLALLALALVFAQAPSAFAYFIFGTVEVTPGATQLTTETGSTVTTSVMVTPPSDDQTLGCGMAKCPQSCTTPEAYEAGYSCFDANGNCTCAGSSYSRYEAEVSAASSNAAVASAYISGGTLVVVGNSPGEATIMLTGTLRQWRSNTAAVHVTVKEGDGTRGTAQPSAGDVALPQEAISGDSAPDVLNEKVVHTVGGDVYSVEINEHLDTASYLPAIAGTDDQVIFWSGPSSEMPDYSWTFSGSALDATAATLTFDPSISVSELGEGAVANIMRQAADGIVLDFVHDGWLAGPASLYVNVNGTYPDGAKLALFRFDPAKARFELIDENLVVADGYAAFSLDHCSTWVLSTDDLTHYAVAETNTPRADGAVSLGGGDGMVVSIASVIVLIAAAALAIVLLRRFLRPSKLRAIVIGLVTIVGIAAIGAVGATQAFAAEPMESSRMEVAADVSATDAARREAVTSGPYAANKQEEQLGLMPRLWRLTGETRASDGAAGSVEEVVGAVFPNVLDCNVTPASISVGTECHNVEMCQVDPCNCGKPDAWGHCACGGFVDVVPTIDIAVSDPGVVQVVEALGRTWLVPVSAGSTHVQVQAELPHYQRAAYGFDATVQPFGAVDALLVAALIIVVGAVIVGGFFLVRFIVRFARSRWTTHKSRKARAAELKKAFPLTWRERLSEEFGSAEKGRIRSLLRPRSERMSPFVHDLLFSLRQALPVLITGFACFCVLVPLSTSMVNDMSVFNIDYTHEQIKYQLYAPQLGLLIDLACAVYGAVLALVLFRFLLAKRATTAFFSVGLSRTKLALSRFITGAICIITALGAPFAISLGLNLAALGLYEGEVAAFFFVLCGYITVSLVAFSLTAVAVACAGTLFEAMAFAAALLGCVTVVLWGVGILAEHLLVGNAAGAHLYGQDVLVAPSLLDSLYWLNPLLFFADTGAQQQSFTALHPVYYPTMGFWPLVLGWFVGYLGISAIAVVLFCRRRGEQAEMAGMSPAFALFAVAVFGLALFAVAVALLGALDMGVALAIGAVLFVLLSLAMMFGPFRGRASRVQAFACVGSELVLMGVVVAVIGTGGLGFSDRIPETEQVEAVEVSYNGSPSFLTQAFSGVSGGAAYYFTSAKGYEDASSIDIVRGVHAQLIASARQPRETIYTDFETTAVPYDVVLRYRLKDGEELVRYYDQATVGELSAMLSLENDALAKETLQAAVTGDVSTLSTEQREALSTSPAFNAYRAGKLYVADGILNRIMALEVDDIERAALLEAIAADLHTLSAQDVYAPSHASEVALMFTLSPELDVASFGYSFSNAVLYVDGSWENTMAWLARKGTLDALDSADVNAIESLTFQLDDPYASVNKVTAPLSRYFMGYRSDVASQFWVTQDYGALKVVSDRDQIAETLPELRLGCYMTGGYLVQAKLRGIEAYVYFYLPAEYAPSFM